VVAGDEGDAGDLLHLREQLEHVRGGSRLGADADVAGVTRAVHRRGDGEPASRHARDVGRHDRGGERPLDAVDAVHDADHVERDRAQVRAVDGGQDVPVADDGDRVSDAPRAEQPRDDVLDLARARAHVDERVHAARLGRLEVGFKDPRVGAGGAVSRRGRRR
jgi:hypothetical protein